ncbi:hypothetical protein [Pyrococcus yayanosii]|uniref:Ribbon-helix-helix protein CopG domain-containing protein n=1 Tax=Pyrococcus yayanosii (strain CH1 / JCM 16557) TaxID=529709 RepID=F8AG45_PYRYC|nr:hypothetical protein [Pyrococcus yayanosii]AEH25101.1 hypothetical protein PYCH_14310 [Pyrococcus yayanosii CH1]
MPRPRKYEYGPALLTISVAPEVAEKFEHMRKELGLTRGDFLAWLLEKVDDLVKRESR